MKLMTLYWDFGIGSPILTTCSSREGYDSSPSSGTTRASRKIKLTIGTIGLSDDCDTFQWNKKKYYFELCMSLPWLSVE